MSNRKRYTKEFKLEAIRLLERSDRPAVELARELGVRRNQLYKWKHVLQKVRPCNDGGCAGWSSAASAAVVTPPDGGGTPRLSPNPSHDGAYSVSWSSASRATYYRLDEKAGQGWGQVYSGSAHQWSASGKADGTYKYKVRPCNDGGCASWSGTATETVSPPPQPPNPPPVPPNPPCPHQPCRQPKLNPAGGASALTVTYTYDAYGNLAKVKNAADGTVYWQADTGASVPAVSP